MRPSRFGIAVVVLVFAFLTLLVLRLQPPSPPVLRPAGPVADIKQSKAELCRLARSEREFFAATGHYADNSELQENGDTTLLSRRRRPYFYSIHVPVPDRFVIVATPYGPLQQRPPALVVDDRLEICAIRSDLPNAAWQLDNPPQRWGHSSYDCAKCQ
jgi:hypothetical protein